MTVAITQLTKSDSGRYRFGLGGSLVPDDYRDIDVRVTDGEFLLKVTKPDIFTMFIPFNDCEA